MKCSEASCDERSSVVSESESCSECTVSLCASTLEALDDLRQQSLLCDCVLICRHSERLVAHRAVLAAASPFLRALFLHKPTTSDTECAVADVTSCSDNIQENDGVQELELDEEADLVQFVIQFAYKGRLDNLRFLDVERLLPLADKWNVTGLLHLCTRFFQERLYTHNCIGIWKFARSFFCAELEDTTRKFILYHICELSIEGGSFEFYGLSESDLHQFLDDDWLNCFAEEDAFQIIRHWIKADIDPRKSSLARLLRTLRIGLCPSVFIQELLRDELVESSEEAQAVVLEAQQNLKNLEDRDGVLSLQEEVKLLRPRIPHDILFAVGGWTEGSPTGCVETYDSKADTWYVSHWTDSNPRAYHGLAVVKETLYIVGGFDGTEYYNSVRSFDPATHKWREAAPMYVARCYVSVTVLDDVIYAIGGFDGRTRLNSAERYDPKTNQWNLISPMQKARSDAAACAFNGKVYIAGGFNGQEVLQSVEVYNCETDLWCFVAELCGPRSGLSMGVLNGTIFVLGGFDGQGRLATGEHYDAKALHWKQISPMKTPRSNFALATLQGRLYAVGGFNGETTIAEVERFDPEKQAWEEMCRMNLSRSAVRTAVIHRLHNARDFSFHGPRDLHSL